MTRTLRAAVAAVVAAGGVLSVGCCGGPGLQARFQDVNNNNSWPERNSYLARQPVLHAFETQANNALSTNDVILTAFFENGTATLNPVGRDKLDQLARKMPVPNPIVYLQTANDVVYDEKAPEKTVAARADLDTKRQQAILAYLNTRVAAKNTPFSVLPIDIQDPSTNSAGPAAAVRGLTLQYRSGITGGISSGNPMGAGGGQATSTIGVAPTAGGTPQPGGSGPGNPGGGMGVGPGGIR
jgi:hypothetical protein